MVRSLLIFTAALFFMASCNRPAPVKNVKTVTVSILPEKYFVEKIAGNLLNVNVMIPPGASPVTYEPSPGTMNKLGQSDMYFRIGEIVFEQVWMKKIAALNPQLKIYNLSKGVKFIGSVSGHKHDGRSVGNYNPHIWMSPADVKIIAGNLLNGLSQNYPSDSTVFRKNYNSFMAEISAVDSSYRAHEDVLNGMSFLIYHPALTYLANEYNMDQISLEFEGKEPPPAHVMEIIKLAREKQITKIFVQEQFNTDNAKALASEINGRIITINPLAEDWEKEMYHILASLINN